MSKKSVNFSIEIIREADEKNYFVVVPSLPGCFSQGKTVEEAKKNIAQAIKLHITAMKRAGEKLPDVESYQTTVQVAA